MEPDIDITVDFVQLWQRPGYEEIAAAERVSLCDTVHVFIDKLGLEVSCKVTETQYDTLLERYKKIVLSNASVYSKNSSLSGALGSISDQAQMATEAVNRVEATAADTRTMAIQQEYFNNLVTGLLGLHYSTGLEDDGSSIRYAYIGDTLENADIIWKYGNNGFFLSTDGGRTWTYGWETGTRVLKLAVEAVGVDGTVRRRNSAPISPLVNDLWVDTETMRLKLWDGNGWKNVGYEPKESPREPETPNAADISNHSEKEGV